MYGYEQQGRIITCAADGRVILMTLTHQLHQKVDEFNTVNMPVSEVLHRHRGRAHRIALIPNSGDQFYSAGEDGECCFFDIRTSESRSRSNSYIESPSDSTEPATDSRCVMKTTFNNPRERAVPIYAISVNPMKPYEIAMCGAHQYCQIFDARKFTNPISFLAPDNLRDSSEHISGLRYDYSGEYLLASYNDDDVYRMHVNTHSLTQPKSNRNNTVLGSAGSNPTIATENTSCDDFQLFDEDIRAQGYCNRYSGHRNRKTVKQVNFIGPYSDYVVSGSDCGHVFIWSTDDSKLIRTIQADTDAINCLSSHPSLPLLAVSGIERTGKLLAPIGEYNRESEEQYQEEVLSNNRDERMGEVGYNRHNVDNNLVRMMLDAISGSDLGDTILTESQMRSALLRFFVERSLPNEVEGSEEEEDEVGDVDDDEDNDEYDDEYEDEDGVYSDDEEVGYYLDDDEGSDDDGVDDDNSDSMGAVQDATATAGTIEDYRGNYMDGIQSNGSGSEHESHSSGSEDFSSDEVEEESGSEHESPSDEVEDEDV
jgi:WD repeat-containing protein 42A